MYTYYGEELPSTGMIISKGDLVQIGSTLDLNRKNQKIGIIIQCKYGFGIFDEEWVVLVEGRLKNLPGTMIWPIRNYYEI